LSCSIGAATGLLPVAAGDFSSRMADLKSRIAVPTSPPVPTIYYRIATKLFLNTRSIFKHKERSMNIGITELLLIAVIVFLLFGTRKLRGIGGDLGTAIRDFKSEKESDLPPRSVLMTKNTRAA
jgi:sec-independent protein translocase protein TatA